MRNEDKTKEQLMNELAQQHRLIAELRGKYRSLAENPIDGVVIVKNSQAVASQGRIEGRLFQEELP